MQHLPQDRYNIVCVPYDTFSGLDEIFIEQARKRGLPPSDERIPWKSRGNWWKARAKVLELVRKYEIDLIHTHDPHSNTMIGIGRDYFPCATVASAYGWWDGFVPSRRFVYQWIERDFALKHFDRVMLLNHKLLGFGKSKDVLKPEILLKAYGNRLKMVDANGNLMAVDDTCCDDEEGHSHA